MDKLIKISKTATECFYASKKILFVTSDEKSQQYLDMFLWKEPSFGFLPHVTADSPINEYIVITQQNTININNSDYIFNLSTEPITLPCKTIYELDDQSNAQKHSVSKNKLAFYRSSNYSIQSI